jgi:hypothetical protein
MLIGEIKLGIAKIKKRHDGILGRSTHDQIIPKTLKELDSEIVKILLPLYNFNTSALAESLKISEKEVLYFFNKNDG